MFFGLMFIFQNTFISLETDVNNLCTSTSRETYGGPLCSSIRPDDLYPSARPEEAEEHNPRRYVPQPLHARVT
jgi:hypothetical protein